MTDKELDIINKLDDEIDDWKEGRWSRIPKFAHIKFCYAMHGVGIYFKETEKTGYNPKTHETVKYKRNALFVEEELPIGNEYSIFIRNILKETQI